MMPAEEGRIGYDEPVWRYLPWLRRDLAERMTVRQLLTHTAGLPDEPICPVARRSRLPLGTGHEPHVHPHKSDYGFGWELPSNLYIDGVRQRLAMRTGRGPGASAIIMRFLDDGLLIVGLQNIQRSGIVDLANGVTNILAGEPNGREPDPEPLVEDEVLRRLLF